MKEIKVKNVIIGRQFEDCENYKEFINIVKKNKIKVIVAEARKKINIEKNLYLETLWPNSNDIISDNAINNNSLVFKLNYKSFSMLFTGDIEDIAENEILETYKDNINILKSTLLKVAHHRFKNFFF